MCQSDTVMEFDIYQPILSHHDQIGFKVEKTLPNTSNVASVTDGVYAAMCHIPALWCYVILLDNIINVICQFLYFYSNRS